MIITIVFIFNISLKQMLDQSIQDLINKLNDDDGTVQFVMRDKYYLEIFRRNYYLLSFILTNIQIYMYLLDMVKIDCFKNEQSSIKCEFSKKKRLYLEAFHSLHI